jgi:aminoglycoside phosphotransferase (APT) family kinase protein
MERAPGVSMFQALTSAPWRVRALIGRLARLQLDLHSLPTDGWPITGEDTTLADRRLAMPRAYVPRLGDARLSAALARAEEIAASLYDVAPVVCHGDFHPLNVLVDGGTSCVIDWTDAGLGDPHGDVSRTALLFLVATVAATKRHERALRKVFGPYLRRRYLAAYTAVHPLDADRLRRWEAMHCVHGWTQVAALHAGLLDEDSKPEENRRRVSPQLGAWLERRFERAAG